MTASETILNVTKNSDLFAKQDNQSLKFMDSGSDQFSKIFESANKSFNFSYEETTSNQEFYYKAKEDFSKPNFLQNNSFDQMSESKDSFGEEQSQLKGYSDNNEFIAENSSNNELKTKESQPTENNKAVETVENSKTEKNIVKSEDNKITIKSEEPVENNDEDPNIDKTSQKTNKTNKKDTSEEVKPSDFLASGGIAQKIIAQQNVHFTGENEQTSSKKTEKNKNVKDQDKIGQTLSEAKEKGKLSNIQHKSLNNQNMAEIKDKLNNIENKINKLPQKNQDVEGKLQDVNKQAQAANTKNDEVIKVKILQDQIPFQKLDLDELTNKLKNSAEISKDLKPIITKLEVNPEKSNNFSNQQNNSNSNNKSPLKFDSQHINNTESSLAKLQFDKTSSFDKVLENNTQSKQLSEGSILNQVAKKVAEQIGENKSQVSIILNPENLGKVNINLITKNGALTAQITAENNQVKEVLNKGLESLRHNLQEQGVSINNLVVKVQEPEQTQNTNQFMSQQKFEQTDQNTANSNSNNNKQFSGNQSGTNDYEGHGQEESQSLSLEKEIYSSHSGQVDYKV